MIEALFHCYIFCTLPVSAQVCTEYDDQRNCRKSGKRRSSSTMKDPSGTENRSIKWQSK